MEKFNTHGGYFAPQGLLKINEGGKHDENPNGGVQIGVDPQGVPNLVEEGEVIYKDFVFSDNIKANKEILEEFNIPVKYADKLYSDIANVYCDEAEEQTDPITVNGLNVMLGRLAEAQEEQKRREEEKALLEELKNMSPEEIAALEQAMAQEAAAQQQATPVEQPMPEEQMQPEVAPEEQVGTPVEPLPAEVPNEAPMMANGGPIYYGLSGALKSPEYLALVDEAYPNELIGPQYNLLSTNHYAGGGKKTQKMFDAVTERLMSNGNGLMVDPETGVKYEQPLVEEHPLADLAMMYAQPGSIAMKVMAPSVYKGMARDIVSGDFDAIQAIGNAALPENIANEIKAGESLIANAKSQKDRVVRNSMIKAGKDKIRFAKRMEKSVANSAEQITPAVEKKVAAEVSKDAKVVQDKNWIQRNWKWAAPISAVVTTADMLGYGPVSAIRNGIQNMSSYGKTEIEPYDLSEAMPVIGYANGGLVNRYDLGSTLKNILTYKVGARNNNKKHSNSSFIPGDRRDGFHTMNSGYAIYPYAEVEAKAVPERTYHPLGLAEYGQLGYLPSSFVSNYIDDGKFVHAPSLEWFNKNFDDAPLAPYNSTLLNEAKIEAAKAPTESTLLGEALVEADRKRPGTGVARTPLGYLENINNSIPVAGLSDDELDEIVNSPEDLYVPGLVSERNNMSTISDTDIDVPELSKNLLRKTKWQKFKNSVGDFDTRLLSPLMDVAMGLANASMPADHYDFTPIRPYLPYGRIQQQYERYNPIDQNLVTNQLQAQANANMRALRNSGLGPSLGANMVAADYVAGQNLGNALGNVWDANNQRYNQVITQNNAADAAIANYDWQIESARANALNQFAPINQRMALQIEAMNNEAEQDKWNAVAASMNAGKKFLNDYGWERMNRNMVNTNRANMGYMIDELNRVVYDSEGNIVGRLSNCGGTLLKNHKKK